METTQAPLLTAQEAAARAGVTASYVRMLAYMGRLPYRRIGRMVCVTPEDLDAWNRERQAKQAEQEARRAARQGEGARG